MLMQRLMFAAVLLVAGMLVPVLAGEARAQDQQPTVVELFTSQGCNSCPPADALLAELSQREDVLAFSFHINYWDYLGWKDTFASWDTTRRQRAYGRALGKRYVYTPQMVIGGAIETIGSHRGKVESAIERGRAATRRVPVVVSLEDDDMVVVRVGAGETGRKATLWLVRYDLKRDVEIQRGENAGKTITYHNVVRDIGRIGTWRGKAVEVAFSVASLREGGRDACAVILQEEAEEGHGPILGAARIALDGSTAR